MATRKLTRVPEPLYKPVGRLSRFASWNFHPDPILTKLRALLHFTHESADTKAPRVIAVRGVLLRASLLHYPAFGINSKRDLQIGQ